LDEPFRAIGFVPLYELMITIYKRLKIIDNFKDNQAHFMHFLELINHREDDYAALGDFLLYLKDAPLEDLYVNVTQGDSIKVLTIHKSKGLEFGVVIIGVRRNLMRNLKLEREFVFRYLFLRIGGEVFWKL